MRVLTVCARGNSRSAALAYFLKDGLGYDDVLACGIYTTKPDTFEMLGHWADKIFVVGEKNLYDQIPEQFKKKTVNIDIGVDQWANPMHPELQALLRQIMMNEKLL
jgi:hypothetical protein